MTLIVWLCLIASGAAAQQYYMKQYRVAQGLPSDIVKASIQDSLGYFWIATDEGFVKYDGLRFTTYRDATRSNYTKGFIKTRSGRLLAYGDLDLLEIRNLGDTVIFKSICPVSRLAGDSVLSYPKLVFEDHQGDLWVSESQAVVRLHNGAMKRYPFTLADRSPQFLRSFAFFEDLNSDLFVSSFQGNVFRYNRRRDAFEPVPDKFPGDVQYVSVVKDQVIIGAAEGISKAQLLPDGGFRKPELQFKTPQVSFITSIGGEKYFIATRDASHFIVDLKSNTIEPAPNTMNNINHVYVSYDEDLWLSGNEGLIMMRENLFQLAGQATNDFIESTTEDPASGLIYYSTSRTLYTFNPATKQNKILLDIPNGYFQSLIATPQGLWVANAFRVFLLVDGKIKHQFDFSRYGRFVTTISRDTHGNIWLAIPGIPYVYTIDMTMNLRRFNITLGNEGMVNMVREGPGGIYVSSAGRSSYLYFKPTTDSIFHNISVPPPFTLHSDFNVPDFSVTGDDLWLASTEGLLQYNRHHVERVNLGESFTGRPVSSIYPHPDKKLLTANAFGLILYDPSTGLSDLFNESSGLKSNTITTRGLFVDSHQKIWVSTAHGLCYTTHTLNQLQKTPAPQFIRVQAHGKKINPRHQDIDYGSFLSIQTMSITFPENEVNLQYRMLPGRGWKTTTENELQFAATDAGTHTLEVRAKKNGPYSWSDVSRLDFTVSKPFWQQSWFVALCVVGTAALVAITILSVNTYNQKKNRELQRLIDDRTHALRISNEELINLNLEKNNLIGIVAHDLKSPIAQIKGLVTIVRLTNSPDAESAQYLSLMDAGLSRLNDMVTKILDIDAIESKQLNLKLEKLSLSDICNSVADRYTGDAAHKRIAMDRYIDPAIFAVVDRNYIEQVLENLLSNAIKFSPHERSVSITLRTQENTALCEIRDEGPGLTEEDKKKLFGKFQKLSAQPTGNEISTGLGLSIAKKFVSAMNGEIWCESEQGKGACFYVSFARA